MRLTIAGKDLNRVARMVRQVTEAGRKTLPVLGSVRLEARPGELELQGTDLEQSMVVTAEADVQEIGVELVNAEKLAQLAGLTDGEPVSLVTIKGGVQAKAGAGKWTLVSADVADFPKPAGMDATATLTVNGGLLAEAISKVAYAVGTDAARANIGVLSLRPVEQRIQLAATDGHRLAMTGLPVEVASGDFPHVLVPRAGLKPILDILKHSSEPVVLGLGENTLSLTSGWVAYRCRLAEGVFPNTEDVAKGPREGEFVTTLPVELLLLAIERVAMMTDADGNRPIRLAFDGGHLVLSAHQSDAGDAEMTLDVPWEHQPLVVGVASRYLEQYLRSVGSGAVTFRTATASGLGPMWLGGETAPTAVIMPVRL